MLVDGVLKPKMTSTDSVYPIASGLSNDTHTVEIYRRTEANQGESQFLGFDFGAGKLLAPPPPSGRRIEVVGDSITCGYGDEGANEKCAFSADTENHYLTYEAIAARDLGAELATIAWSGKGVVCNYGDDASSCTHPMPEYYDRVLPARADSAWDFALWQPHAVVINLGTNDFSTSSDPTSSQFETEYVKLLQHIRSKYSGALILCTVAPLLTGTDLTTARTCISNAVKQRNDAGDARVKAFEMATADANDGYGCDWHPSRATHQKMATELIAKLKAELQW